MSTAPPTSFGLRVVEATPTAGLILAERRVDHPLASVIAVHGGLDRAGSFARLARRLDDFDVVAYDRRGYQGSRDLGVAGLAAHVKDLVAVARREAEAGPVVLFGHSFGGVVALAAAVREPGLARLVVVYETPLPWVVPRPGGPPAPVEDPGLEAERFFRRVVSPAAWERLSAPERESRRLDGPALLSDLASLRGPAPFDIADLVAPAAYVHGDAALAPYYRHLGAEVHRRNPGVEVIELAHAGHGAHLSQPGHLASLIGELWERRCASV